MNATLDPAAAIHNRMSGYFADESEQLKSIEIRHEECALAAVVALTKLLSSDDPAIVLKAAGEILSLEKTRMRHGAKAKAATAEPVRVREPRAVDSPRPPKAESAPTADELAMLEQLEKMFEMAAEEDEEEAAPTEDEAIAYHAAELRAGMSRAAKMNPGPGLREVSEAEAVEIVQIHLKAWNVAASEISKGGFWREVAKRTKQVL
jgi:hypothetical protein